MRTSEVVETIKSIRELLAKLEGLVSDSGTDTVLPGGRSAEEITSMVNRKICLRCNQQIGEDKEVRGVHERCYQKLRRDHMLESAIAIGHCLPAATPGPKAAPALILNVESDMKNAAAKAKAKIDGSFSRKKK